MSCHSSFPIEQLSFYLADFAEILYWGYLLKCAHQIQVWFKWDKMADNIHERLHEITVASHYLRYK
jgi:hypothetical protein